MATGSSNIADSDTLTNSSFIAQNRCYFLRFPEEDFVRACNDQSNSRLLQMAPAVRSSLANDHIALLPTWMFLSEEQIGLNVMNGVSHNTNTKEPTQCASNDTFLSYSLAFSTSGNLNNKIDCLAIQYPKRRASVIRHIRELINAETRYINTTKRNLAELKAHLPEEVKEDVAKPDDDDDDDDDDGGEAGAKFVLVLVATSSFVADMEFYNQFHKLSLRMINTDQDETSGGDDDDGCQEDGALTTIKTQMMSESGKRQLRGLIIPVSDVTVIELSKRKQTLTTTNVHKPDREGWVSLSDSIGELFDPIVKELTDIQRLTLGIVERENHLSNPGKMWYLDREFTKTAIKLGFDRLRSPPMMPLRSKAMYDIVRLTEDDKDEENDEDVAAAINTKQTQNRTKLPLTDEEKRQANIALSNIILSVQLAVCHSEDCASYIPQYWINSNVQAEHVEESYNTMLTMLRGKASLLLAAQSTMYLKTLPGKGNEGSRIISGYDYFTQHKTEPFSATLLRLSCGSTTRALALIKLIGDSWWNPRSHASSVCDICTELVDCCNRAFGQYEETAIDRKRAANSKKSSNTTTATNHRYTNVMTAFVNTRGVPNWNQTFTPMGKAGDLADSYDAKKDSKPLTEDEKEERRRAKKHISADNGSGMGDGIDFSDFANMNVVFGRTMRDNTATVIKDFSHKSQAFRDNVLSKTPITQQKTATAQFLMRTWGDLCERVNSDIEKIESSMGALFTNHGFNGSTFDYRTGFNGHLCPSVNNRNHIVDGPLNSMMCLVSNVSMMQLQLAHQRGSAEPAAGWNVTSVLNGFTDLENNLLGSVNISTKRMANTPHMRVSNGTRSVKVHRSLLAKASGKKIEYEHVSNPNADQEVQVSMCKWVVSKFVRLKYFQTKAIKPEDLDGGGLSGGGALPGLSTGGDGRNSDPNLAHASTSNKKWKKNNEPPIPTGLTTIANSFTQTYLHCIMASVMKHVNNTSGPMISNLFAMYIPLFIQQVSNLSEEDLERYQQELQDGVAAVTKKKKNDKCKGGIPMRQKVAMKQLMTGRFSNIPHIAMQMDELKLNNDVFLPMFATMMASQSMMDTLGVRLEDSLVCPILLQKRRVYTDLTFMAQYTVSLCVPVACNTYDKYHKLQMKPVSNQEQEERLYGIARNGPAMKYRVLGGPNFATHMMSPNYDGGMGNHQEFINQYGRESVKKSDADVVFNPLWNRADIQQQFAKDKNRTIVLCADLYFAEETYNNEFILLRYRRKLMHNWLHQYPEDSELSVMCQWSYETMGSRADVYQKVAEKIDVLAEDCGETDRVFFKRLMQCLMNHAENEADYNKAVDDALQVAMANNASDKDALVAIGALFECGEDDEDEDKDDEDEVSPKTTNITKQQQQQQSAVKRPTPSNLTAEQIAKRQRVMEKLKAAECQPMEEDDAADLQQQQQPNVEQDNANNTIDEDSDDENTNTEDDEDENKAKQERARKAAVEEEAKRRAAANKEARRKKKAKKQQQLQQQQQELEQQQEQTTTNKKTKKQHQPPPLPAQSNKTMEGGKNNNNIISRR